MMLAAIVACQAAVAQPAFEPVVTDATQAEIVEQIQETRARDGNNSEGLIVPLTELAHLYVQDGELALANAALDQAMYIIRVNNGLYSLDQVSLLQQAIANDTAGGDLAAAWKREQELIELARRHPEDLRTVPIFREVADGRKALFEAWMAGEYPEQMIIGEYCGSFGELYSCSRRAAARGVIGDTQMYYADAIEVLLRNELYSSDELRALETELVRTSDQVRQRPELAGPQGCCVPGSQAPLNNPRMFGHDEVERHNGGNYGRIFRDETAARLEELSPQGVRDGSATQVDEEPSLTSQKFPSNYLFGRQSLVRLYDYEVASSAPLAEQARAFVELADWDLLYSRNSLALDEYEQVYARLREDGAAQAVVEELFAPRIPIVLPAFLPPLAYEQTEGATGYIDVGFRISKLGEPQRIEILDATANVTDAAKERLVLIVKTNRFRPRLTDGEFRTSSVVVRYHIYDAQPADESSTAPP
jgi:hypothetical protein